MERRPSSGDAIRKGRDRFCGNCLYYRREAGDPTEHCFRFARFVDHAIHDASRDCDYWTPPPDPPQASA